MREVAEMFFDKKYFCSTAESSGSSQSPTVSAERVRPPDAKKPRLERGDR